MKKKKVIKIKKEVKTITGKIPQLNKTMEVKESLKNKFLDKFRSTKPFLIEMKFYNGSKSHFVIPVKGHKFEFGGNAYIIDEEMKVFCNTSKMYMLHYHEGFAMPYLNDVSASQLKGGLGEAYKEITTSFNPSVLKDILKFEYAKGVIQGAEVHEFIKRSFIISVIILVAVLAHGIVNGYFSGWFG